MEAALRMDRNELIRSLRPYIQQASHFSGWSFSKDSWRRLGPPMPWDYASLVRDAAKFAKVTLDMGTGGGEFLAEESGSLNGQVVATEEWKVNVPVAKKRLSEFGFEVVECRSVQLPFKDASFDLVLNRQEDLEPREVARIIAPGGRVVTQQVGRDNWRELRRFFPRMTDPGDHRGKYVQGFQDAGLKIIKDASHDYKVAYRTLGDFVFMLAVTPWTIPDLCMEKDIDALVCMDQEYHTSNGLEPTLSRFLIVADKPKS